MNTTFSSFSSLSTNASASTINSTTARVTALDINPMVFPSAASLREHMTTYVTGFTAILAERDARARFNDGTVRICLAAAHQQEAEN
jgi:hypothetical protein